METDLTRSADLLVSIITPSFNQARYLEATLRSVAIQDYPRIEHIVMDGGSTDRSVEILDGWAGHSLRWQSSTDGGQAEAIQRGVQMASGEVLAWLNSDDIYLDSRVITDVVRQFDRGAVAVTGAGWYLSETGRRLRHIPIYPDRIGYDTLKHVDWILQPATFVRRDVLVEFPIDTSLHFAFDWDLFVRLSRSIAFTPFDRDIAGYRVHPTGKTVSGGGRRQRELLEVTGRYSPKLSARYALSMLVVATYRLAEHLPAPLPRFISGVLTRVALLSHKLTDGRGIQY